VFVWIVACPVSLKTLIDTLQRKKMRKEVAVEELALKKMRSVYLLMSAESGKPKGNEKVSAPLRQV